MLRVIIKNITVCNFGAVERFTYAFKNGVNVIKDRATDELACAIAMLINNNVPFPATWAGGDTEINAEVKIGEQTYLLRAKFDQTRCQSKLFAYNTDGEDLTEEYLYLCSHCDEHNTSEMFDGNDKTNHLRFLRYANEDYFYSKKELSRKTDRFSNTQVFRSYLWSFIKSFKPQNIRDGKKYEIILKNNGIYDVQYSGRENEKVYLSESEQKLFRYLCFLNTAEFWRGFEEIRNLNGVKKPLIIKNFFERLDESIDVQEIMQRAKNLKRQLVVLTLPSVQL